MDLNSMFWFLGICLATQCHQNKCLDGHLKAKSSNQRGGGSTIYYDMSRVVDEDANVWLENRKSWDTLLQVMNTEVENTFGWIV